MESRGTVTGGQGREGGGSTRGAKPTGDRRVATAQQGRGKH